MWNFSRISFNIFLENECMLYAWDCVRYHKYMFIEDVCKELYFLTAEFTGLTTRLTDFLISHPWWERHLASFIYSLPPFFPAFITVFQPSAIIITFWPIVFRIGIRATFKISKSACTFYIQNNNLPLLKMLRLISIHYLHWYLLHSLLSELLLPSISQGLSPSSAVSLWHFLVRIWFPNLQSLEHCPHAIQSSQDPWTKPYKYHAVSKYI